MTVPKIRRVRVCTRLPVPLRDRLTKYCAASGLSERSVIENALQQYLVGSTDKDLLLRRFDRVDQALGRERHHLELLSEAFGRYLRVWFGAHAPPPEAGKPAARKAAEAEYKQFIEHLGKEFARGHRFLQDLPPQTVEEDEEPAPTDAPRR
jgi:hypothetical protein